MKRWIGCGMTMLVLLGALVAVGAWGLISYHVLVREQIKVEAAWSSLENLWQRRSSLAAEVVEWSRSAPEADPPAVAALSEARARMADVVLSPAVLDEPQRLGELQRLEAEQAARLWESLRAIRGTAAPGRRREIGEIEDRVRTIEQELAVQATRFNDAVAHYDRLISRFPMSAVAGLGGFRSKPRIEVPEPGPAPVER